MENSVSNIQQAISSSSPQDECDVFGKLVATKLKVLMPNERDEAMMKVLQCLKQA